MKKAIVPLALAVLIGGCAPEKPKVDVLETTKVEAPSVEEFVPDELHTRRFRLEQMKNQWAVDSSVFVTYEGVKIPTYAAARVLPVGYEYNYKGSETIDGISVGIEGCVGPYLNPDRGKPTESVFDMELCNYTFGDQIPNIGDLPEGHSLFKIEGWNRKPTDAELERMMIAFEKYVVRNGKSLELGLTSKEMSVVRKSVNGLKKLW